MKGSTSCALEDLQQPSIQHLHQRLFQHFNPRLPQHNSQRLIQMSKFIFANIIILVFFDSDVVGKKWDNTTTNNYQTETAPLIIKFALFMFLKELQQRFSMVSNLTERTVKSAVEITTLLQIGFQA